MLAGMRWLFVIAIASAIGCRDEELAKLEAVRDEVCACKTAECGEAAMKQLPAAGESSVQTRKVAKEVVDCLRKLLIKRPEDHDHDDHDHDAEPVGSARP